ncbi:hypothetical protein I4U23_027973 [Adineta vaga]|nr:hypothetical protein I4U23_027973 [Adineta vaga]
MASRDTTQRRNPASGTTNDHQNNQNVRSNFIQMMTTLNTNIGSTMAYKFRRCEQRTMIVLERARVGKTTLIRMLFEPVFV